MKNALITAVLGMLAVSAFAHGGAEHVIGFVRAITATSITVEDAKHEMVTVLLRPNTEVKKNGGKVKIGELKVGDRVVIHAEENKADKLEAEEVEFGSAPVKP
jgi:hypothetical protein